MYGNNSAGVGVGVGGVLLTASLYMCPTVECILCSEKCVHSTLHEAVSDQVISELIPTLQY